MHSSSRLPENLDLSPWSDEPPNAPQPPPTRRTRSILSHRPRKRTPAREFSPERERELQAHLDTQMSCWLQVLDLSYQTLAQKARRPRPAPSGQRPRLRAPALATTLEMPRLQPKSAAALYEEHLLLKKKLRLQRQAVCRSFRLLCAEKRVMGYG
jgi:hypothetical protein